MELTAFFDDFLVKEVNLNQDRLDLLNEKIEIIEGFFKNSDTFKKYFKGLIPQGSFGQKTIIKPPRDKDFDVDILLSLESINNWQPTDYIEKLHSEFYNDGNYKKIVEKNTRCVTLNYKGDFHVDIVPFLKVSGSFCIPNNDENKWESTNPIAYTEWLMAKNVIANNYLIKAIRLFKYLRDIKQNFSVKSILLSTLIGNCIGEKESVPNFKNQPTSFVTIFGRLNDFLQSNPNMPTIKNPTLTTEDFNRYWDREKYSNFRDKIKSYYEKAKDAYQEQDKQESIKKWKLVFGDEFPDAIEEDEKTKAFSILSTKSKPWSN